MIWAGQCSRPSCGRISPLRICTHAHTHARPVLPQGLIRPALDRLCDQYRTKTADLSQDLLSLQEQAGSSRDVMMERREENAMLEEQVRRGREGEGGREDVIVCECVCISAPLVGPPATP